MDTPDVGVIDEVEDQPEEVQTMTSDQTLMTVGRRSRVDLPSGHGPRSPIRGGSVVVRDGVPVFDDLTFVGDPSAPAARCVVCGNHVEAGGGLSAIVDGRLLRFKCSGCVARFRADPERFLAGGPAGGCGGVHGHDSPASEWTCD
jgi:hypothetical protein